MLRIVLAAAMTLMTAENPSTQSPVPLMPIGKWNVDGSNAACTLSHDFGPDLAKVTIAFRPAPLDHQFDVLLLTPGAEDPASGKAATVMVGPSGRSVAVSFKSVPVAQGKQTLTRLIVHDAPQTFLARATTFQVTRKGQITAVALPRIGPALAALKTCQDALLTQLGVDPSESDRVSPSTTDWAIGDRSGWITYQDYPDAAFSRGQQGAVTILWTIGLDGRAHDCRAVVSSGIPSLDVAACDAIIRRARYRPILDKAGHPMIFHESRLVEFWTR